MSTSITRPALGSEILTAAVYVSDHKFGKIYEIRDGGVSVFVEGVKNPNGVLSHRKQLYVLAGGAVLHVQPDRSLKTVVVGLGLSVDGIENIVGDDFLVTCSKGIIYEVNVATGVSHVLLDEREAGIQSADLGYDARNGILYVPTLFSHRVIAYQLQRTTAGSPAGNRFSK